MTQRKMKSARPDGRGHWPSGKRRNVDRGNWSRVRMSLARFIDDHWAAGKVSIRALADEIAVNDRTIRRWLSGEDRPSESAQEAIEQWLIERRKEARAKR